MIAIIVSISIFRTVKSVFMDLHSLRRQQELIVGKPSFSNKIFLFTSLVIQNKRFFFLHYIGTECQRKANVNLKIYALVHFKIQSKFESYNYDMIISRLISLLMPNKHPPLSLLYQKFEEFYYLSLTSFRIFFSEILTYGKSIN